MFYSADLSLTAGKNAQELTNLSRTASGMICLDSQAASGVKIAALGSLKRVTGRIFKIRKFKGAS